MKNRSGSLSRIGIKWSLFVICAVSVLALVAVIGVSVTAIDSSLEASRIADSRMVLRGTVGKMQERTLMAFAVTSQFAGDTVAEEEFKEVTSQSFAFIRQNLDEIEKNIRGDEERGLFEEIVTLFGESDAHIKNLYEDFDLDLYEILVGKIRELRSRFEGLLAVFEKSQAEAAAVRDEWLAKAVQLSLLSGLGAVAILLSLIFFFGRGIVRTIGAMTAAMGRLADGDLETEVPAQGQRNEIGEMAKAVQVFKDNAVRVKQMEAEREETERRTEEEKREMMNQMADDLESNVKSVIEIILDNFPDIIHS